MKTISNTSLARLVTKIKAWGRANFLNSTDVITAQSIGIDNTPTESSDNLITSGGVYAVIPHEAVKYVPQSLTSGQKQQARTNIGAGTVSGAKLGGASGSDASVSNGKIIIPQASASSLGLIKADTAQATDTQPCRIGADGKLYTAQGGGGGATINNCYCYLELDTVMTNTYTINGVSANDAGWNAEWSKLISMYNTLFFGIQPANSYNIGNIVARDPLPYNQMQSAILCVYTEPASTLSTDIQIAFDLMGYKTFCNNGRVL